MFHVLSDTDLTDKELMTAMVIAEGLMNSRPITYQSSIVDDPEPLTRNHFLSNNVASQNLLILNCISPEWRGDIVQKIVHLFWRRWLGEWLPSLSPRRKWGKERRDLQVSDLVLVLSTDVSCGKWPMGRTVQVFPGPDGHVRTADVKVKGLVLRRPIDPSVHLNGVHEHWLFSFLWFAFSLIGTTKISSHYDSLEVE